MQYYMNNPYSQQSFFPPQNLNGRIVDTLDTARVADVPFGGYGIFPKADFSEIYLKSWNQNGTTSLLVFKPLAEPAQDKYTNEAIVKRLDTLEEKVNNLKPIEKEVVAHNEF